MAQEGAELGPLVEQSGAGHVVQGAQYPLARGLARIPGALVGLDPLEDGQPRELVRGEALVPDRR